MMDLIQRLTWLDNDELRDLNSLKLQLVADGHEICDLGMINPDIPPPRFLMDKLLEASVRPANHRYAVARGIRKLREAFSEKYRARWGVVLQPESEVCVTMGSKDALEHALMGMAADGDRILIGVPTYPAYISAVRLARLTPTYFTVSNDEEQMLREIEECCKTQRPKILLLNFPHNPTGVSVSSKFYDRLLIIVRSYNVFVINDFVYGEMHFETSHAVSLLQTPGMISCATEVYSLSKAYSIPGWRVGAMVGNPSVVKMLSQIKAHIDYGIFLPIQHAASAALVQGERIPHDMTVSYKERCEVLHHGLQRYGWEVVSPQAGCCIWARLPESLRGIGAVAAARKLLVETGIVGLPGTSFIDTQVAQDAAAISPAWSEWMRFALVQPLSKIRNVLEKMRFMSASQSKPDARTSVEGAVS